jgi:hypothetical protein
MSSARPIRARNISYSQDESMDTVKNDRGRGTRRESNRALKSWESMNAKFDQENSGNR